MRPQGDTFAGNKNKTFVTVHLARGNESRKPAASFNALLRQLMLTKVCVYETRFTGLTDASDKRYRATS